MGKLFAAPVCLLLVTGFVCAQTYLPGQVYFGANSYIEYLAGDSPLIISVPHGGDLEPTDIPDRDCEGCSYLRDSYTQELAREIRDFSIQRTGCYPHVIINRLHRKKLDMNRELLEATDSMASLEVYWKNYQDFITAAKDSVVKVFGKGLFIDLHGHGHTKQRIEYGYLLYGSQLRESDSVMNTPARVRVSSIRNLAASNLGDLPHADLIRGGLALGTLFADRGFPGVPSRQDPFPLADDPYFNGGYNTLQHGSSPGGTIDAVQMELYSAIRFNTNQRRAFADSFVRVTRSYLEAHYFPGYSSQTCQVPNSVRDERDDVSIYPNPVVDELIVRSNEHGNAAWRVTITDIMGYHYIDQTVPFLPATLSTRTLPSGAYIMMMYNADNGLLRSLPMTVVH